MCVCVCVFVCVFPHTHTLACMLLFDVRMRIVFSHTYIQSCARNKKEIVEVRKAEEMRGEERGITGSGIQRARQQFAHFEALCWNNRFCLLCFSQQGIALLFPALVFLPCPPLSPCRGTMVLYLLTRKQQASRQASSKQAATFRLAPLASLLLSPFLASRNTLFKPLVPEPKPQTPQPLNPSTAPDLRVRVRQERGELCICISNVWHRFTLPNPHQHWHPSFCL
jgi:hypothetical protein